jgi:3-deoxy-manno-octulosonate cytidylyltransferase (CMP-KDO synthetase)
VKVLGIIPCRYGSTRFPGKPLIDLKGKSMIQRVYEGALKSNRIDKLIVATDDERIFSEVKRFGGEVMMTSSEHENGTQRCAEVLKRFSDYDIVLNIQGDEPLVNFEQLNQLIHSFLDDTVEIATLAIHTSDKDEIKNPNRIKVVTDAKKDALYFSRSTIPFARNDESNFNYQRHIGLYGFRAACLNEIISYSPCSIEHIESLEQLRWMYHGKKIRVVETSIETPNIDTPEDIAKVLMYL